MQINNIYFLKESCRLITNKRYVFLIFYNVHIYKDTFYTVFKIY